MSLYQDFKAFVAARRAAKKSGAPTPHVTPSQVFRGGTDTYKLTVEAPKESGVTVRVALEIRRD